MCLKPHNRNRHNLIIGIRIGNFDYLTMRSNCRLIINKKICSQRNTRAAGSCSPFFLYTPRLHQSANTASRQLWLSTLINSGQLLRWSDDISLLNHEQGYKVPFFVDYCRLADDISLFKQDHRYKVPFFCRLFNK